MLQPVHTVDIHRTLHVACQNYWRVGAESNHSLWYVYHFTIAVLVEVSDLRSEVVLEQVPDLNSAVICHGSEN